MPLTSIVVAFLKMILSHTVYTSHPKVHIRQYLTSALQAESDHVRRPTSQTPCPREEIVTSSSMLDVAGAKLPFWKLSLHVAPGILPWRTTSLIPHNGPFFMFNLKTCLVGSRLVAPDNKG